MGFVKTIVDEYGNQRLTASFHFVTLDLEIILWSAIGLIDGTDVESIIEFYTLTEGFKQRYLEIHTGSHCNTDGTFGPEDN